MPKKQRPKRVSLEAGVSGLREKFGRRLVPPLEGVAYRFTIWLPVQAEGKPVFTENQRMML
jgi:hypothetical protein